MGDTPWWRDAVIYQIYPRSWADSNGDGVGDLPGITERLSYLADLGVDAVWLSPFYTSPQRDAGYDVADFCAVDPLFGTLDDFDRLVARAHDLGLRVIVDIVPNHTSSDHPWFKAALASEPGSPERDRYTFRDGPEPPNTGRPNNWVSMFGGPAWSRAEPDGQWYLHLFDSSQPDLNWTNPQVVADFDEILRFWLDRGVDGFRIDVADGMAKAAGLPDMDLSLQRHRDTTALFPMWDQPGVHDIFRRWRSLCDSFEGDRLLCAEAWVEPPEALARYVREDELHQSFNFHFLQTAWNPAALRASIEASLASVAPVGAPQTWVLSNHDVVRHSSRLGRPDATREAITDGIGPSDPQPDATLGLRRARAATALMLALPGAAYLYQGEELGLPDATQLPDAVRQDPRWHRTGGADVGRDGCRVPMPWERKAPAFGFSPSGASWLPQPDEYGPLSVDQQIDDDGSTLALYRRLIQLRRERRLGRRALRWVDLGPDVLAFDLTGPEDVIRVVTNFGSEPVRLPESAVRLVDSELRSDQKLQPDMTGWLQLDA